MRRWPPFLIPSGCKSLRTAAYAEEFLRAVSGRRWRNPETDRQVLFTSLPSPEQQRIYEQWRQSGPRSEEDPGSEEQETERETELSSQRRVLQIVQKGNEVDRKILSEGDQRGRANVSYKVTFEDPDGTRQDFIHKPAKGELGGLRAGIRGGTYHLREQMAYGMDTLFGEGTVTPPTFSGREGSGSYQAWEGSAQGLDGGDLKGLGRNVKVEELYEVPTFNRMNLLDLIVGNEDRHEGNILWTTDQKGSGPESVRFITIDNGLSLASPKKEEAYTFQHPFASFSKQTTKLGWSESDPLIEGTIKRSLSEIPEELRTSLKNVKLDDVVKQTRAASIDEEGAVRGLMNRIVALQEDPEIFKKIFEEVEGQKPAEGDWAGTLERAWRRFQYESTSEKLLKRAGAQGRASEVDKALRDAKPEKGWHAPEQAPERTVEEHRQKLVEYWKGEEEAKGRVASRWIRNVVGRTASCSRRRVPRRP